MQHTSQKCLNNFVNNFVKCFIRFLAPPFPVSLLPLRLRWWRDLSWPLEKVHFGKKNLYKSLKLGISLIFFRWEFYQIFYCRKFYITFASLSPNLSIKFNFDQGQFGINYLVNKTIFCVGIFYASGTFVCGTFLKLWTFSKKRSIQGIGCATFLMLIYKNILRMTWRPWAGWWPAGSAGDQAASPPL